MRPAIAQFLREHLPSRNLNPAYRYVERWAQAGEVALLVELLVALEELPPEGGGSPWARAALADHVERTLALTPGETQVEATLAAARLPRVASVQRPRDPLHRQRQLATYLAFAQPPALLLRLFERPDARASAPELLAALLQELLVRGQDVSAAPGARAWAAELVERGHPLGWLPLQLEAAEAQLPHYLPRFGYQSSGNPMLPAGLPTPGGPWPPAPQLTAVELTRPADQDRLAVAVAHWRDDSNGTIEARIFALDPPLPRGLMSPAVLLHLGLECLADSSVEAVELAPTTVTGALTTLFVAAIVGGAYTRGFGVAYSRLAAWQSLGALAGLGPEAPFTTVVLEAEACAWWAFDGPNWFSHIAWDLGLLALHPAGDGLAVLAATDTD